MFPLAMYIGTRAFANCTGLSLLAIPLVTNIKDEAFMGCSLLSVFSPDNVLIATSLGSNAFNGCTMLHKLVFPQLTTLGSSRLSSFALSLFPKT